MNPKNRSINDIFLAIAPAVALMVGLVFLAKGLTWHAVIILIPTAVFFIWSFAKMPWQEIGQQEVENREKLLKTRTGKLRYVFIKLSDYFSIVATVWFALLILAAMYFKVFQNGS